MSLERFVEAQEKPHYTYKELSFYARALIEIQSGKKNTDWIWFIFPQLDGFGYSYNSTFYGIKDLSEAEAYLQHPVLGNRLKEISQALFALDETNPEKVVGHGDHYKLCSSMTLFSQIKDAHPIFRVVLEKYFSGNMDDKTLKKLRKTV